MLTFAHSRVLPVRSVCARILAVAALLSTAPAFAGVEYVAGVNEATVANQLLVKFQQGVSTTVINRLAPGATSATVRQDANIHLIKLPPGTSLGISSQLAALPGVVYVEPNRIRKSQALIPNDPRLSAQWALQNIQATQAWGVAPDGFLTSAIAETGRIRVAVLDTGVDCTHPDFANAGGSSTDTAAGGQLNWSLSKAYDATLAGTPCSWGDDFGHGTHVTGIIAAAANNGQGIAGVAYPVEILVYKVLDSTGSGNDSTISQAIVNAANNGASVISLSLGGPGYSQTLQSAINYAWQKNVLVVVAAGNSSSSGLFFPAGANYAIGVAATDTNDALANFSNFGQAIAVGAPGVNVLSTLPTYATQIGATGYGQLSGTSMAAPHVSAEAGMLFGAIPNMTAALARMLIEESADNGNAGGQAGQQLGYGRINLWRALSGSLRPSTLGGIAGQVVDVNGNSLPTATINVAGRNMAVLGDSATFRVYGLAPGSYTATVSAGGFPTGVFQVTVVAGADTNFTPVLGSTPAQFSGVVTDNGQPVVGAVVEALSNGLIQATAVTGTGGAYTLYVQPGTYDLQTSALYHVTTTLSHQSVGANGNMVATLSLPAIGTIAGNVKLPNGAAAANATVDINGPRNTTTTTDNNGNYSSIGLPPGGYTVTASASGQTNVTANTAVNTDAASIVNLQFGGSSTQPSAGPLRFVPVTPCRIADTRNANGAFGGPELSGGNTRDFSVPNSSCGVPSTAAAYALNVTVVPDARLGYLSIWPSGQPQPLVSTLNSDGRIKANAAIVPAGNNGAISVFVTDSTQLVLDITGYFEPDGTSASELQFYPMSPCRVADTRQGSGPFGAPFLSGGAAARSFPMQASSCNIPAAAQAYSLNFTAVPHGPLGYITAWPTGQNKPLISTLNASTGAVTANAAIVPTGTAGQVSVYASDDTDLVIDINGYFAPPGSGGLDLFTLTPCRVLDTRNPPGSPPFKGMTVTNVGGSSCLPQGSGAHAFVLNATVVPPGPLGFLTLWPDAQAQPLVSTLNAPDGAITSNMAIVPSTNGSIDAFTSDPAQLILDISGYFAP
jgi:thermitase